MAIQNISKTKGFTLVEVVIVLAITVIVSGVAAVSLGSLEKKRISAACDELVGDLRYAQRMAVLQGREYSVQFDTLNNGYELYYTKNSGTNVLEKVLDKQVSFDNGVTLLSVNASGRLVSYTPMGTTGDACTIVLQTDGYSASITVNVGSGRVLIKEIVKI